MYMPTSPRAAFTLVELSIVLVILGLLVGGVLSGQSLIHAAELRRVSTEFAQYKTAYGAFKDKYLALPGDMKHAVAFWGAIDGGTADGLDTDCMNTMISGSIITDTKTCNGDGSGVIGENSTEGFAAWQHLANAGLIEGVFHGPYDAGNVAGQSVPASRYSSGAWSVGSSNMNFIATGTNTLAFGKGNFDQWTGEPVLSTQDAYAIDKKMDDGYPHIGAVTTYNYTNLPHCITSTNDAYALSDATAEACSLFIKLGY